MSTEVLIVDDELRMRRVLQLMLEDEGYRTLLAENGQEALETMASSKVDLVITDMRMPEMNGLELLRNIKKKDPHIPVIIMTAYGTVKNAVEAMKQGAWDYIIKPFEMEEMKIVTAKALEVNRLRRENIYLRGELSDKSGFAGIVGQCESMQEVFQLIDQVARTAATVLILGESGTGKELVARAIHAASPRRDGPFIVVNCGATLSDDSLLQSELFGHVKGAFTGAHADKPGRFELADGGTIFLDELALMNLSLQGKLLRVLEQKQFESVGGTKTITVDVRIIGATNRDLRKAVEDKAFRDDLYYRLNVVSVKLPPLRDRREDIPLLANHFLTRCSRQLGKNIESISPEATDLMARYDWPGNVRELENVIERAIVLGAEPIISPANLPAELQDIELEPWKDTSLAGLPSTPTGRFSLPEVVENIEKNALLRALSECNGNKTRAADMLGLTRKMLRYKIRKYGLGD